MNKVSHKHIVQAIGGWYPGLSETSASGDVVGDGGGETEPFIVMESVSPGNLGEALRSGFIGTLMEKLVVLHDVADALVHIRPFTVVHRDIKQSNILVDMDKRAKVTDFGLSRMMTGSRMSASRVMGSVPYLVLARVSRTPCSE
eukprot:Plantae.Rhodophyta-Rhodochaete_pulchella.ctg21631.p1 GENE.Plantae.Rhodophyta-Rhodochaete_pulchella.ctg21631~~Plantae.Rhodophyta-Rhodochaete_pulchella.ctg21631.p1  ORF type:complete len:144 (+),score=21.39 Plantae.Rhodophyta-Rhodochaete_pulchella.ctg21631:178-609(+)